MASPEARKAALDRRRRRVGEGVRESGVTRDLVELGPSARAIGVVDRERCAHALGDLRVGLARLAVRRDAEEHQRHRDHRDDHDDREEQKETAAEAHKRCYPGA